MYARNFLPGDPFTTRRRPLLRKIAGFITFGVVTATVAATVLAATGQADTDTSGSCAPTAAQITTQAAAGLLDHITGAAVSPPITRAGAAFTAWQHHRTRANLNRLVVASFPLPPVIAADIGQLYADEMGGAERADIDWDITYIGQDLTEAGLPTAS